MKLLKMFLCNQRTIIPILKEFLKHFVLIHISSIFPCPVLTPSAFSTLHIVMKCFSVSLSRNSKSLLSICVNILVWQHICDHLVWNSPSLVGGYGGIEGEMMACGKFIVGTIQQQRVLVKFMTGWSLKQGKLNT